MKYYNELVEIILYKTEIAMANFCEDFGRIKFQILATIIGNILGFSLGCSVGWLSPMLPILLSDASPLAEGKITIEDAGWIASLFPLSAVFGTLSFGFLSNCIGSKRALLLCCIPVSISWFWIIFGQYTWHIFLARVFAGFTAGGTFLCIPLFVAEIADDYIRGQLNSYVQVSCYSGTLAGFIAGTILEYKTVPFVMITMPVLFFCLFAFMPNSPQFLLKCNKFEEAEKALRFYRNCKQGNLYDNIRLKTELDKFKAIAKQNDEGPSVQLSDFFTKAALRAMLIGPTLMAVSQFSGTFTLCSYAATIFRESGSTIDPNVSSIVMGTMQVCGTYCASRVVDSVGRKKLLLISTAGGAVGLAVTGVYSYLAKHGYDVSAFNLLPIVSLSFFIFISAIGIIPVPYVLVSEVIPQKIRRIGATICTCTVFIFGFIMLKSFPILLINFELYGCMSLFATVSVLGFLFTFFVVEETKGINLDVLEESK